MPSGWIDSGAKNWRTLTGSAGNGLWIGLSTTTVSYGSSGTEVTGGSYTRRQITWAAATNPVTGTARKLASANVGFPGMPAATVVGYAIWTAATGGSTRYWANFVTPITVTAGQALIINASSIAAELLMRAPTRTNDLAKLSDAYLRNVLDNEFGSSPVYSGPSSIGLATSHGTATTPGTEVSGGGYSRQTPTSWTYNYYSNYSRNSSSVVFSNLPATTILGINVYSPTGTYLFYSNLNQPYIAAAGSSLEVPSTTFIADFSWSVG